jgi:hypothetical protein
MFLLVLVGCVAGVALVSTRMKKFSTVKSCGFVLLFWRETEKVGVLIFSFQTHHAHTSKSIYSASAFAKQRSASIVQEATTTHSQATIPLSSWVARTGPPFSSFWAVISVSWACFTVIVEDSGNSWPTRPCTTSKCCDCDKSCRIVREKRLAPIKIGGE